ncbi:MAG: DUF2141 domain-containing protein [Bacteroidota bacterium]
MRLFFIIPFLLVAHLGFSQITANLTVSISNIEVDGTKIYAGLYANINDFKKKSNAIDSVIMIPKTKTVEVLFKNVPGGYYAFAVFQDLNSNGKLDTKEFGIPIEPVGISNYSSTKITLPPTFKKAKFYLSGDTLISVLLLIK